MKKNSIIAAFLLMALAGCSRVESDVQPQAAGEEVLTVRFGSASTRVDFDDEAGAFTWTEGDKVAVHCGASANGTVDASYKTPTLRRDATDPSVGRLSLILSEGQQRDAYAVYPAASAVAAQWGSPSLQLTYPTEYEVDPAGMGNEAPTPMVAVNDPAATELTFRHVGGLLRLTLNYVAGETKFITVSMGKQITGTFTVEDPSGESPSVTGGDSADEVTFALTGDLAPGFGNTLVLNVPIPSGTYESLTITALDADRNALHSYYDEKERQFFPGRGRKQAATLSSLTTPLCLEAAEIAAIHITNPLGLTIEVSNDAVNWRSINAASTEIWLGVGDKLYFRGNNRSYATSYSDETKCTNIRCDGECYLYGNIMSLVQPLNFDTLTRLTGNYNFARLFYNSDILIHPSQHLLLPATTLTPYCYAYLFCDCASLQRAPELPAATLNSYCYYGMFSGCHNLKTPPALNATELKSYSYYQMFSDCISLEVAPELPAMTLGNYCYAYMFQGCTRLQSAPVLPATKLENSCYAYMFQGCTSLMEAPVLQAMELAKSCYSHMFENCTGLRSPAALPATLLFDNCYEYMFSGCSSLSTVPVLPAEEVAVSCYSRMFTNCTSITTPPVLPATTMKSSCYSAMFSGCTSLLTAPQLPALTLANSCYSTMFESCESLKVAPALPATTLAPSCYMGMFRYNPSLEVAPVLPAEQLVSGCYTNMFLNCPKLNRIEAFFLTEPVSAFMVAWVSGVSSTGTFVMNRNATWDPSLYRGGNAIPSRWTVETN